MDKKRTALKVILTVAVTGFIVCIAIVGYYFYSLQHSKNTFAKLQDAKNEAVVEQETSVEVASKEEETETVAEEEEYVSPIDFAELKKDVNGDIYAWIQVDGTTVDYPVLQHESDNTYYMTHNLDDSYGYPGCIYTEFFNNEGFIDPITAVYGHYMKDGTMFASLHRFMDKDFFDEHDSIVIYLPEEEKHYTIVAATYTDDKRITVWYDMFSEEGMQEWVDFVLSTEETDTNHLREMELSTDDTFIALETCVDGDGSSRYLVVAVEDKESEN